MSTSYAMEDDQDPDINEPVLLGGELENQETSDVMERAPRVRWEIKKAEVRTQREDSKDSSSPWTIKRLSLQVAVGPDGTDNEGTNANRRVFMDYILAFNASEYPERFGSEWWQKKARGPAKELFSALEYDLKDLPPIDAEFLAALQGREFIADLLKKEQQDKTDEISEKTGKPVYKNNGTYRNELSNHRVAN